MTNATSPANAGSLPAAPFRTRIASAIERLIGVLDSLDAPYTDLEDDAEDDRADEEPSLGATDDIDQCIAWGPDRMSGVLDGEAVETEDDIAAEIHERERFANRQARASALAAVRSIGTSTLLSRRALVIAIAATPAAAAPPLLALPAPAAVDPVYAAIKRHRVALAAFVDEADRQDDLDVLSLEDEAKLDSLSEAESHALMDVADASPSSEISALAALSCLHRFGEGRYRELLWTFGNSLIASKLGALEKVPR